MPFAHMDPMSTPNIISPDLKTDLIGVILAGGKSSRMGTDKALLKIRGITLLESSAKRLQNAGCHSIFLSGHARYIWRGPIIPDLTPHHGPVLGIISAILSLAPQYTNGACIVFTPIDMPCLESNLLTQAIQYSNLNGCRITHSPLPLVLKINMAIRDRCEAVLSDLRADCSYSLEKFIAPLDLHTINLLPEQDKQMHNINTYSDWLEWTQSSIEIEQA